MIVLAGLVAGGLIGALTAKRRGGKPRRHGAVRGGLPPSRSAFSASS